MSADNVILVQKRIIKERNKRRWCVWHQSASCPWTPDNAWGKVMHRKNKRDALVAAHNIVDKTGLVEYGVVVI